MSVCRSVCLPVAMSFKDSLKALMHALVIKKRIQNLNIGIRAKFYVSLVTEENIEKAIEVKEHRTIYIS
jgi:hypothetical protein